MKIGLEEISPSRDLGIAKVALSFEWYPAILNSADRLYCVMGVNPERLLHQ